jgi:hypothetical protein
VLHDIIHVFSIRNMYWQTNQRHMKYETRFYPSLNIGSNLYWMASNRNVIENSSDFCSRNFKYKQKYCSRSVLTAKDSKCLDVTIYMLHQRHSVL